MILRQLTVLFVFLIAGAISGCADTKDSKTPPSSDPQTTDPQRREETQNDQQTGRYTRPESAKSSSNEAAPAIPSTSAKYLADTYQVSCGSTNSCQDPVGVMFGATGAMEYRCMVFLAGEFEGKSVIGTNKHCAEEVRDFYQEVFVKFPKYGSYPDEVAVGYSLLKMSEFPLKERNSDGEEVVAANPDFAFIQLDRKLKRQPLKLSQNGVGFSQRVSTYQVSKSPYSSHQLTLEKIYCSTIKGQTLLNPNYKNAKSPNIGLFDCKIKSGDSGSPVFNSSGEVSAIIQIAAKEGLSRIDLKGIDAQDFDVSKIAFATNLSCVDFPEIGLSNYAGHENCEINRAKSTEEIAPSIATEAAIISVFRQVLIRALEFIESDPDRIFSWTLNQIKDAAKYSSLNAKPFMMFEFVPSCVFRVDDSVSTITRFKGTSWYFFEKWQDSSGISYQLPSYAATVKIDEQGAAGLKVNTVLSQAILNFSPSEIATMGKGDKTKVHLSIDGMVNTVKIPLCDPNQGALDAEDNREMKQVLDNATDEELVAYLDKAIEKDQERRKLREQK